MGNISHITHKKSNELNSLQNTAKKPSSDDLEYGELAVNYKTGHETLFIKNDTDNIVGFVNENKHNTLKETVNSNYREFETEQGKVRTNTQDINTLKNSVNELSDIKTQFSNITSIVNNLCRIKEITKNDLMTLRHSGSLDVNCVYKITDYIEGGNRVLYVKALTHETLGSDAILKKYTYGNSGINRVYVCKISFGFYLEIIWVIDENKNEYYFDIFEKNIRVTGSNNVIYSGCDNITITGGFNVIHSACNNITITGDFNVMHSACNNITLNDGNGNSNNTIYQNCNGINIKGYSNTIYKSCRDIDIKGNNNTIYQSCHAIKCERNGIYSCILHPNCDNIVFLGSVADTWSTNIGTNSVNIKINGCNNLNIKGQVKNSTFIGSNNIMIDSGDNLTMDTGCHGTQIHGYSSKITLGKGCEYCVFQGQNTNITLKNHCHSNVFSPHVQNITCSDEVKINNFIYPGAKDKVLTSSGKIIGVTTETDS